MAIVLKIWKCSIKYISYQQNGIPRLELFPASAGDVRLNPSPKLFNFILVRNILKFGQYITEQNSAYSGRKILSILQAPSLVLLVSKIKETFILLFGNICQGSYGLSISTFAQVPALELVKNCMGKCTYYYRCGREKMKRINCFEIFTGKKYEYSLEYLNYSDKKQKKIPNFASELTDPRLGNAHFVALFTLL